MRKDYGNKFVCFNCTAKFYDMGNPLPICPLCEADQTKRPKKKEKKSFQKFANAKNGGGNAASKEEAASLEAAVTKEMGTVEPVTSDEESKKEKPVDT